MRGVFPVHERFWFCLVQVSTTQFCCFPPVLMARASDGTDVPVSPLLASSSNMGSPNGSLPDLEGTGYRASTKYSYTLRYSCRAYPDSKIASKRFPRQWPLMMRKLRILNKWLAALQPVLPYWKRMQRPSPVDPTRQDHELTRT